MNSIFDLHTFALALAALLEFGIAGWVVSVFRHDVSIVDGMWPLMFLVAALCYVAPLDQQSLRGILVVTLVLVWSVRLSAHIFWRNRGSDADYIARTNAFFPGPRRQAR